MVIPDTQNKPGTPVNHLEAAGQMVVELRPDVLINLADWWDMPSLSSYDEGTIAREGVRYADDIRSGNTAMDIFLAPLKKFQATKLGRDYNPRKIFVIGNHEFRILRHAEAHPYLERMLSYADLNLKDWFVYPFLGLAEADGIYYSHYFANPMSGKPYGGTIQNMLSKIGMSFTMGHVQKLSYDRKDLPNGAVLNGLIAGAFYQHDEAYKGPQGNHHWRGLVYKHNVHQGNYDLETWSLDRVLKTYG